MKLNPNCLKKSKLFGWSAQGYLLPCCWCDLPSTFNGEQGAVSKLVDPKFHIDKINNFEEVINSQEWKDLYAIITDESRIDEAPAVCKRHCGQGKKSYRETVSESKNEILQKT